VPKLGMCGDTVPLPQFDFMERFQIYVFWVMTTWSVVVRYQRFGGPRCLHLQKLWYSSTTLHGVTTQKT